MRFLFQMRPLEDGIFLDVGAGGHAEHFIVVTGADAASGTLPREVVLVDDLPGGDVAVGDEGAAGVLAGGLLGGQRFDAHFPDHGQRPLEILAEELEILVIHSVVMVVAGQRLVVAEMLFKDLSTEQGGNFQHLHIVGQGVVGVADDVLREMADEEYLAHRLSQVRMLGDMLIEGGVPIIRPVGGHAIFIDAGRFFPHIPQKHFPADVLSIEIYREGAVRGVGLGALAFEDKDPVTGEKIMPKLELYRMAIARRTYSNSHMEYIARTVIEVYRRRDAVRYGLRLTYEPPVPGITHFLARLEPFAL